MSTTQAPGSGPSEEVTPARRTGHGPGDILAGFGLLLGFQILGEALNRAFHLPLPGPVLGMGLLALALGALGRIPQGLARASHALLSHMPIFFVPAGVGVLVLGAILKREALPILVALVASTVLALAVTALVMKGLVTFLARRRA